MKIPSLLLLISILLSCSTDKNCEDDVIGTYSGNCNTGSGTINGDMIISQTPAGGKEVSIEDKLLPVSGYMGTISSSCNSITITNQQVTAITGNSYSVNGILHVNGTSITGTLVFDDGVDIINGSYQLMKK